MYYVVGLGNPGEKYTYTRHNVGWLVLDSWRAAVGLPELHNSAARSGQVTEGVVAGAEVTVLYPSTFMNNSGQAVVKLVPKTEVDQLVVVYDDIDIPLGEIKVSVGKGSGGHNGVQSIIDALGSKDFIRIRVGICPHSFWTGAPKRPVGAAVPQYVLKPFSKRELTQVSVVGELVSEALALIMREGPTAAMNRFN